jgi:sugar lactone lactonase YvrE
MSKRFIFFLTLLFSISSLHANIAPTVTSSSITSVDEDSEYSYTITSSDANQDNITWSSSTVPSWLTFFSGAKTTDHIGTKGPLNGGSTTTKVEDVLGIVQDSSGTVYFTEGSVDRIRKYDPNTNLISGFVSSLDNPSGLAIDSSNNLYVADTGSNSIKKINSAGSVLVTVSSFSLPRSVAVSSTGDVYVADTGNNEIKKIASIDSTPVVTTIANGFDAPTGLVIDSSDNILYVADSNNNVIKKIDLTNLNTVSTFAGNGSDGDDDDLGTAATFTNPSSLSIDNNNTLFVGDDSSNLIRRINTITTEVTTFAGDGISGEDNGNNSLESSFNSIKSVYAYDVDSVYIADTGNYVIRNVVAETSLIGTPTNDDVGSHNVALSLTDSSNNTTNYNFSITVNNTNDTPSAISFVYDTNPSNNVKQSLGQNALVGAFSTTDDDSGDSFTYQLISGSGSDDNSLFTISGSNLLINDASSDVGTKSIRVQSTDLAGASTPEIFTVVIDDDISPVVSSVLVPSNNTYITSSVLTFTVNTNENITVTGSPQISLDIGGSPKYATYSGGTGSSTLYFTYNIESGLSDISDGISINSLGLNSGTLQDSAGNDLVLTLNSVSSTSSVLVESILPTLSSISPTLNEEKILLGKDLTLTFSENVQIGSGNIIIKKYNDDTSLETIAVSDSSKVTVSNNVVTISHDNDFDLNTQYYINIDATAFDDIAGNSFAGISSKDTMKFTSINNIAPVITSNSGGSTATVSINENTTSVTTVTASDADVNPSHNLTFSKSGTDSPLFNIDSSTGELNFVVAPNYEVKSSYLVTVTVTDDGAVPLSDSQDLTVSILDVNEAPKVTSTDLTSATEDVLYSYSLIGEDEDGNHITWAIKSGETIPSWLTLSTQNVSVYAGSTTSGSANAQGESASFYQPKGMAKDSSGNIYVADTFNHLIRKIDSSGNVTTITTDATFSYPSDLDIDSSDDIYVADTSNNRIVKLDSSNSYSSSLVASGITFAQPEGISIDSSNNVYIADTSNHRIIKVTSAGVASTFTGGANAGNTPGFKDDEASKALFNSPTSIDIDSSGNLIVSDKSNHKIRRVDSSGTVTTIAGNSSGSTDANGTNASFNAPAYVTIDSNDNIYIVDSGNNSIRKIDKSLNVITLTSDDFSTPTGIVVSNGDVFISDTGNNRIKKVQTENKLSGTPTNSDVGTNTIHLVLSDGFFDVDHSFDLTVGNVNDDPVITLANTLTTDEDVAGVLNYTYTDVDGDTVTPTQKTAPSNGAIVIDSSTITYTPSLNFNGSDSFTVTFSDGEGFTQDVTVTVTINAINDTPVISGTLSNQTQEEDGAGLIIDLSSLSVSDVDSDASAVTYSASSSDDDIAKARIENGRLIVVPEDNASGVVTITLTATVDGLGGTLSFTYTLTEVNDSPTIQNIPDASLEQSSSDIVKSIAFDIWDDSTVSSLSVISSNTTLIPSSDISVTKVSETQGRLDYTVSSAKIGSTKITITARDASGKEYNEAFDITVKLANDAQCLDDTKTALTFDTIKGSNLSQNLINTNLNLVSTISSICASTITWSSSNSVISSSGLVTADANVDYTVLLTATITKDNNTKKDFLLIVPSSGISDSSALEELTFELIKDKNLRKNQITSNLDLPSAILGKSITWSSNNETVLNPYSGVVSRSGLTSDASINLTATTGSSSKVFALTILKELSNYEDIVNADKELLTMRKILGLNTISNAVIYNLEKPLPIIGENGSSISWLSSDSSVITSDGEVLRDSQSDKTVRLKATIAIGSKSDTKEFIFTVLKNVGATSTSSVSHERIDETSDSLTMVTNEDGQEKSTVLSFDSSITSSVENIVNNNSVKSTIELTDKYLSLNLNSDGTSESSLEFKDDNNNSIFSSLSVKENGSSTSVDANGNVTSTINDSAKKLDLSLTNDGTASHTYQDKSSSKTTSVSSTIEGSKIDVSSSGEVQLVSEYIVGNKLNKIVVVTTNGKSVSKFIEVDLSTSEQTEKKTIANEFSLGSQTEVEKVDDVYYIKTKTTIGNLITIE